MDTERIVFELQKLNTRADRTDALLATLDSKVGRIEVRLDRQEGQLIEIATQLAAHGTQLAAHGTQLAAHGTQLAAHGTQLAEHSTQLAAVNAKLLEHDAQFVAVNAKLAEHDVRFDRLEQEVRREGEETRRYMKVLHEDLQGSIRVLAEGHATLVDAQHRTEARLDSLEERTTLLELAERERKRAGN